MTIPARRIQLIRDYLNRQCETGELATQIGLNQLYINKIATNFTSAVSPRSAKNCIS